MFNNFIFSSSPELSKYKLEYLSHQVFQANLKFARKTGMSLPTYKGTHSQSRLLALIISFTLSLKNLLGANS